MIKIEWEGNPIEVTGESAKQVTEQLINSHVHMVRGAMRVTKQPMVIWVSGLDLDTFKDSSDVSKEVSGRQDEDGKALDRPFNFHSHNGQHFALSMSMQMVEVSRDAWFPAGGGLYWIIADMWGESKLAILAFPEDGSNPVTGMVTEPPMQLEKHGGLHLGEADKFKRGGVPSTTAFGDSRG